MARALWQITAHRLLPCAFVRVVFPFLMIHPCRETTSTINDQGYVYFRFKRPVRSGVCHHLIATTCWCVRIVLFLSAPSYREPTTIPATIAKRVLNVMLPYLTALTIGVIPSLIDDHLCVQSGCSV